MTAEKDYICHLRRLWKQAFGDSDETLDAFFSTAFSPDRHASITQNNIPVSALYWFDCHLQGHRLAYIYAVATDPAFRRQGHFCALMEQTHRQLQASGYSGVILVPGEPELFALYEKFGYRSVSTAHEFSCTATDRPLALQAIDLQQYASLRRRYLPPGGVLQEAENLAYLQTYASFYAGEQFVMAASLKDDILSVHEFLGDPTLAGTILHAMQATSGTFRMPGPGRDFAMFLPLRKDCPAPSYFGLAFD